MEILGLELPLELEKLIKENKWDNEYLSSIQDVFPEKVNWLILHNFDGIIKDSKLLREEYRAFLLEKSDFFWQGKSYKINPKFVLILGTIEVDSPFALNYEQDSSKPTVIYFNSNLDWQVISDSFVDFINSIAPKLM